MISATAAPATIAAGSARKPSRPRLLQQLTPMSNPNRLAPRSRRRRRPWPRQPGPGRSELPPGERPPADHHQHHQGDHDRHRGQRPDQTAPRSAVRSDQVPLIISTKIRPRILSHRGPCSAAVISDAAPKDSSTTSGHTALGQPDRSVPGDDQRALLPDRPGRSRSGSEGEHRVPGDDQGSTVRPVHVAQPALVMGSTSVCRITPVTNRLSLD